MPIHSSFRASLHGHSIHSDGANTVFELAKAAHRQQLSYLALTDHNTVEGIPTLYQAVKYLNQRSTHQLIPIAGIELMTAAGEIIILKPAPQNQLDDFLTWATHLTEKKTLPPLTSTVTTAIQKHHALIIIPHPFFNSLGMHSLTQQAIKQLHTKLDESKRQHLGLEIHNWCCNFQPNLNYHREQLVDMLAHQLKLAHFGGADYHADWQLNAQTTIIPGLHPTYATFIQAVRQRKIYPGPSLPLTIKTMTKLYITLGQAFIRSKFLSSNQ